MISLAREICAARLSGIVASLLFFEGRGASPISDNARTVACENLCGLSGIDPAFIAASFRQGREKGSKFFAYDLFVKTRFEFFAHFFHVFGLM